jgi:hypothetical protein
MTASEIRIGNYLQWNNFTEARIMNGKDFFIVYDSLENSDGCIEPIPLTEEWCIKFGFQKDLENTIYKNINKHCFLCYDDNIVLLLEEENNWCITKVKYVHQLQNLYFALTNEELTIKQTDVQ